MSTATAPPESVEGPPSTDSASRPRKRRSFPWNDVATTLAAFALAFLVGALFTAGAAVLGAVMLRAGAEAPAHEGGEPTGVPAQAESD